MHLDHDLHIHTYLSACCKDRERQIPIAILATAEEMGVKTIGFADHVWMNPNVTPSDWYRPQGESQITRLRADLAEITTTVNVIVGCEADTVAPGKFSITAQFAEELDFVLLACSHFHMRDFVAQPKNSSPRHLADHMLVFFRSAVKSGFATSIAHPLLPLGYLHLYDDAIARISDDEFVETFGEAQENGIALEITTGFLPDEPGSPFSMETPIRFLSLARQAGCKFTLGSDAHSPADQRRLPELVQLIEAAGISNEDLLLNSPPA